MTGLVLEGGANRAYFSVGVMDAFMKHGIKFDYIIGVSAGISHGITFAAGQPGRCYRIGTEFVSDKRYMGLKHMLNPKNKSYFNIDFVFHDLPNIYLPFDYESFKNYKGEIYAVVTNLETGKAEYIPVDRDDKQWTLIKATCALPFMFPPIEYKGRLYMDGGIADPIPIKRAMDDGCDKVVAILTREREYEKTRSMGSVAAAKTFKKYPEFAETLMHRHNVYQESKEYLNELEKAGKAFIIAPESTKGWGRTDSDPQVIKGYYDAGFSCVEENLDELLRFVND